MQLAEQRTQQRSPSAPPCPPHPSKSAVKRQTKRPRLQKPAPTAALLTPPQFTILSPISLSSLGQPFAVAELPLASLAQSANTVTFLPAGSQVFTRNVVSADGKAEGVTLRASSNLALVDAGPARDSSRLGPAVKPVELLHLSRQEARVLDGAVLVRRKLAQGEARASQERALIQIEPRSVGEGEIVALQLTGESDGDEAAVVRRGMELAGVRGLDLDAAGHVPDVHIVVIGESIQEENQVK